MEPSLTSAVQLRSEQMRGTPAGSDGDQRKEPTPDSVLAVLSARTTWEQAMDTKQNEAARNSLSQTQSLLESPVLLRDLERMQLEHVAKQAHSPTHSLPLNSPCRLASTLAHGPSLPLSLSRIFARDAAGAASSHRKPSVEPHALAAHARGHGAQGAAARGHGAQGAAREGPGRLGVAAVARRRTRPDVC